MLPAKDLKQYIGRKDVLLLDLREEEQYEKEHVLGAVWADWETLEENIEEYVNMMEEVPEWVILYCDRGNTSLLLARDLARRGYPVMSVNGGYTRYREET